MDTVLVSQDVKVPEISYSTMRIHLALLNCTFKTVKMVNFILCVYFILPQIKEIRINKKSGQV